MKTVGRGIQQLVDHIVAGADETDGQQSDRNINRVYAMGFQGQRDQNPRKDEHIFHPVVDPHHSNIGQQRARFLLPRRLRLDARAGWVEHAH